MTYIIEKYDFIFRTANFMLFTVINISYISLNMHFEQEHKLHIYSKKTKNSLENQ